MAALDPKQLKQAGATDGQALAWNDSAGEWQPAAAGGGSDTYEPLTEIGSPTNGMAGYVSGDDEVTATDSSVEASSRFVGVRTAEKVYQVTGEVAVQLVASLTVAAGNPIFLTSTAGLCTNVMPTSGFVAEIGVVVDLDSYLGVSGETVQMVIQPKPIIERS